MTPAKEIPDIKKIKCPVCAYSNSVPFYDSIDQPLSTIAWPGSESEANKMKCLPMKFVQCLRCSHIWNKDFSYKEIPYSDRPNRMFNTGLSWRGHLAETRELILSELPSNPTVVDIGCGDGHFVSGLGEVIKGERRLIGFDPNTSSESGQGLEFYPRLFEPSTDIRDFSPDCLVLRHVLEHMVDPSSFLDSVAWGATAQGKKLLLFAEVPCVDRALKGQRLADFFYEHFSHFTSDSFKMLIERAGEILHTGFGYNKEVQYAIVEASVPNAYMETARFGRAFHQRADKNRSYIQNQLESIASDGQRCVIWGGTGKAATFINTYIIDPSSFSMVVDSDPIKIGTHVPGAGQRINSPDLLDGTEIDTVIIPAQWRAKDIVEEMKSRRISASSVLIEHEGRMVDFFKGAHPYSKEKKTLEK